MRGHPQTEQGHANRRRIMEIISDPDQSHTIRAISASMGLQYSTVHKHVRTLQRMGYLAERKTKSVPLRPLVRFGTGVLTSRDA